MSSDDNGTRGTRSKRLFTTPQSDAQSYKRREPPNGVAAYANVIFVLTILGAVQIGLAGKVLITLYIGIGGLSASALFYALGAIVDRLNTLIELLDDTPYDKLEALVE